MLLSPFGFDPVLDAFMFAGWLIALPAGIIAVASASFRASRKLVYPFALIAIAWNVSLIIWAFTGGEMPLGEVMGMFWDTPVTLLFLLPLALGALGMVVQSHQTQSLRRRAKRRASR